MPCFFCFFLICFSIHLYLAQCINPKPVAEKTILNIENFRGNIHNVMSKKQPEVRSRTAFLSCILTISTGSISGHNLSFGLYIQAMAFSKISASLSCLLLVCCAFVILYWMQQRQIFLLSSLNPPFSIFSILLFIPPHKRFNFLPFKLFGYKWPIVV